MASILGSGLSKVVATSQLHGNSHQACALSTTSLSFAFCYWNLYLLSTLCTAAGLSEHPRSVDS